jgi:hypothetical protein
MMGSWGAVVFSFFALIGAIYGLAVLGSPDAAADELIARLGIGICAILGLVGVYLYGLKQIPAEWDEEARKQIYDLESQLAPRLEFTWRAEDNKYFDRRRDATTYIGRVAVKNTSKSQTVRGVDVTLIHYKIDGVREYTTLDRKLVANSVGHHIVNINPWREENFNLFRIEIPSAADTGGFQVTLGPFANGDVESLSPGRYQIKVTASGDCVPSVPASYLLSFPGAKIEFRPWRDGDTLHEGDDWDRATLPSEHFDTRLP